MELRTLPVAGLRPILSFLNLKALVKLFATFDRRLQQSLSTPGAFDFLAIETDPDFPRAPLRYFLAHVRDVMRLKFEKDVFWSPATLPFLKTLNPRFLVIDDGFMHQSNASLLLDFFHNPEDPFLKSLALNYLITCVPNFSVLTPRLESLDLNSRLYIANPLDEPHVLMQRSIHLFPPEQTLLLPPTITHFSGILMRDSESLTEELPSSLTSLSLSGEHKRVISFSSILKRLPNLQSLDLNTFQALTIDGDLEYPQSLTSLSLLNTSFFPLNVIQHPSFRNSSLFQFALHSPYDLYNEKDDILLDLSLYAPTSLRSADIYIQASGENGICARAFLSGQLPLGLVHLKLRLDAQYGDIFNSLAQLSSLMELEICLSSVLKPLLIVDSSMDEETLKRKHPIIYAIDRMMMKPSVRNLLVTHLPPGLKILKIQDGAAKDWREADFGFLPSGLLELHTASFMLQHLAGLQLHSPLCHLYFTTEQGFTSPLNCEYMREQFTGSISPVLDAPQLYAAICKFIDEHRIHISPNGWSSARNTISLRNKKRARSADSFVSLSVSDRFSLILRFFCLSNLQAINPAHIITEINFGNFQLPTTVRSFPPTLTKITSTSVASLHHMDKFSTHLAHLDAPNWNVPFYLLVNLKWELVRTFKCSIVDVRDYNVLPFLKHVVPPQARQGMRVSLSIWATGSLIHRYHRSSAPLVIDAHSLVAETEAILKRKIFSKKSSPNLPTESADLPDSIEPLKSIGDCVERLEVFLSAQNEYPHLVIPHLATEATVSLFTLWMPFAEPVNEFTSVGQLINQPRKFKKPTDESSVAPSSATFNIFKSSRVSNHMSPLSAMSKLHTLKLDQVYIPEFEQLISLLPGSLRCLSISTPTIYTVYSNKFFPRNLRTLIINTHFSGSFSFQKMLLPPSIRRLHFHSSSTFIINSTHIELMPQKLTHLYLSGAAMRHSEIHQFDKPQELWPKIQRIDMKYSQKGDEKLKTWTKEKAEMDAKEEAAENVAAYHNEELVEKEMEEVDIKGVEKKKEEEDVNENLEMMKKEASKNGWTSSLALLTPEDYLSLHVLNAEKEENEDILEEKEEAEKRAAQAAEMQKLGWQSPFSSSSSPAPLVFGFSNPAAATSRQGFGVAPAASAAPAFRQGFGVAPAPSNSPSNISLAATFSKEPSSAFPIATSTKRREPRKR